MTTSGTIDTPAPDQATEAFRIAEEHFGHVPNLVRALAPNPALCHSITAFFAQTLKEGRVSWAFKELVILKTLRSVGSYYGYGAHERLAAELGNSARRIGDVSNSLWVDSPHFSDAEKAVLELVDQIGEDANAVSQELWDRLKAGWDAGQLLELTAVITTFIMIGRVGDALGVAEPELFKGAVA
jgi:alkylhydroperoxidase family enzyme